MSGAVTRGQALELQSRFGLDTNWDELDGDFVQQNIIQLPREELGRRFTAFLRTGAQIVIGEPRIIKIDRSVPFDPAKFIGQGWTIWKGLLFGNGLEGAEQQDEKSLALTEVDLTRVQFQTTLKKGETWVNGIERQKRLKAVGYVRLDAKVFQTFWENPGLIPESYKRTSDGSVRYMYFDGTVLRSPDGPWYILCLYFRNAGWHWSVDGLGSNFRADFPSVVLASPPAEDSVQAG